MPSITPKHNVSHSVGRMVYPIDLEDRAGTGNNPYGDNYVQFNINVHQDSKLIQGKGQDFAVDITDRNAGDSIVSKNITPLATSTAAGVAGAVAGSKIVQNVLPNPLGSLIGAGLGAFAGAGAANIIGTGTAAYKQLKATIALHMPMDLSIKYKADWKDADTAMMAGALQGASMLGSSIHAFVHNMFSGTKITSQSQQSFSDLGAGMLGNAALTLGGPLADVIGKVSGVAANPKKELLFKNMDFRTFSFTYDFYSRNEKETQKIHEIIKTFKYHMHPEFKAGTADFLYIYPSEFEISYHFKQKNNDFIHKHTSCVLIDMDVKYNPYNQFVVHNDGSPVTIRVVLTFKELAVLTRKEIEDGY